MEIEEARKKAKKVLLDVQSCTSLEERIARALTSAWRRGRNWPNSEPYHLKLMRKMRKNELEEYGKEG